MIILINTYFLYYCIFILVLLILVHLVFFWFLSFIYFFYSHFKLFYFLFKNMFKTVMLLIGCFYVEFKERPQVEHISCPLNLRSDPFNTAPLEQNEQNHSTHRTQRIGVPWYSTEARPCEWIERGLQGPWSGRAGGSQVASSPLPPASLRCSPLILSLLLFSVFINKPQSAECRLACCFLATDTVDGKYLNLLHSF